MKGSAVLTVFILACAPPAFCASRKSAPPGLHGIERPIREGALETGIPEGIQAPEAELEIAPPAPAESPLAQLERTAAGGEPSREGGAAGTASAGRERFDGMLPDAQIIAELDIPHLSNPERERHQIEAFRSAGADGGAPLALAKGQAPPLDVFDRVITQPVRSGASNVYVVQRGKPGVDRWVVVGGHMDRVEEGNGIVDNWTGAKHVSQLYRLMRGAAPDANIVYINFAKEEDGLVGSTHWLDALPRDLWKKIDLMLNLDTMAIDATAVLMNGSTAKPVKIMIEVAQRLGIALVQGTIRGGDSDHTTFRRAGIPSLMEYGASTEAKIFEIIHSARDQFSALKLERYKDNLRLALEYLKVVAQRPVREPIVVSSAGDWSAAGPIVAKAFEHAAGIDAAVAAGDYAGLKEGKEAVLRALELLADGNLLKVQLLRALDAIQDILWGDARVHGVRHYAEAERLSAAGLHERAAEEYVKAAGFYREGSAVGEQEARYMLELAAKERGSR